MQEITLYLIQQNRIYFMHAYIMTQQANKIASAQQI